MLKAKQIKRLSAFSVILAITAGCSDSEFPPPLADEPAAPRSEATLVLTDADGAPITGSGQFFSDDPDFAGESPTEIPEGGVLNIAVSSDALDKVGAGQSVSISGRVVIPGYLVTPIDVEIDEVADISGTFISSLVSTDGGSEIEGVEIVKTTVDTTGSPTTITVTEDDGATPVQRSVVSINQLGAADLGSGDNALSGFDEDGNKVALTEDDLSNLVIEVAHFDAMTNDALDAFPGGFAATIQSPSTADYSGDEPAATRQNSDEAALISDNEVIFQSAGFIALNARVINSDGSTVEVTDLGPNKIVTVRMDIPADTVNPETGNVVAVNDTVPVWGLDTRESEWRYEGRATVQQDSTGLFTEYQPTHLSYFNLDWYGSRCKAKFTLVDETNTSAGAVDFRYFTNLTASGFSRNKGPNTANQTLTLNNMPDFSNGLSMEFRTSRYSGTVEVTNITRTNSSQSVSFGLNSNGVVTNFNPCSGADKNYQISVVRPAGLPESESIDISISTETYCLQDPSITAPYDNGYSYVYLRPGGSGYNYLGSRRANTLGLTNYSSVSVVPGQDTLLIYAYDRNALSGQQRYFRQNLPISSGQSTLTVPFRFARDCPTLNTGTTGTTGSGGSGG